MKADIWRTAKAIKQAGCRDVLIIYTPEFVRFIVTIKFPPISLGLHFMKTKALVATLLVAAAASADARLASPFPRKPLPPDEIGHWIVINSNPWSHDTKAELATFTDGQTRRGEASPFGGGPDGLKSSSTSKEKAQLKTGMFHSGLRQKPVWASRLDS